MKNELLTNEEFQNPTNQNRDKAIIGYKLPSIKTLIDPHELKPDQIFSFWPSGIKYKVIQNTPDRLRYKDMSRNNLDIIMLHAYYEQPVFLHL